MFTRRLSMGAIPQWLILVGCKGREALPVWFAGLYPKPKDRVFLRFK